MDIEVDPVTADKFHQLKCHVLLNGKKFGLSEPIHTEIKV